MTLLFITGSEHKFKEVQAMFADVKQHVVDLDEIQSLDAQHIMRHKMAQARQHVSEPFILEDTAFYIEALNGFPGPLVKWFNKQVGVPRIGELFAGSKAYAETLFGYWDGKQEHHFVGRVDGILVRHKTTEGFGFDIIFQPDGWDKTFAEGTLAEKNAISHRGKALQKLIAHLT